MPVAECVGLQSGIDIVTRTCLEAPQWTALHAAGQQLDWDEGLERGEGFSHEAYTRQLAEDLGA